MVSKKVLGPALAGTGAVGASGTLAWALGLFDEEGLGDVVEVEEKKDVAIEAEPNPQENVPSSPEGSAKQSVAETQNNQTTRDGARSIQQGGGSPAGAVKKTWRTYFSDGGAATTSDRKVFDSGSTLKVVLNEGLHSLIVEAEKENDEDFSWKCTLKAISVEGIISSSLISTKFKNQKKELEDALNDEENKRQFVTNCSNTRLTVEKPEGKESTIELETEGNSWSEIWFKKSGGYFERLWTEDFSGIDRLSEGDKKIVEEEKIWNISGKKEGSGTEGKVTVSLNGKDLTCNISGDYGKNLGTRTFKDSGLKDILELGRLNSGKLEKKRYLIRNCRKNKEGIKGLKINVDGSSWWFEGESLKKITEGMYENPTET